MQWVWASDCINTLLTRGTSCHVTLCTVCCTAHFLLRLLQLQHKAMNAQELALIVALIVTAAAAAGDDPAYYAVVQPSTGRGW
jgi:hypothetical protein